MDHQVEPSRAKYLFPITTASCHLIFPRPSISYPSSPADRQLILFPLALMLTVPMKETRVPRDPPSVLVLGFGERWTCKKSEATISCTFTRGAGSPLTQARVHENGLVENVKGMILGPRIDTLPVPAFVFDIEVGLGCSIIVNPIKG